MQVDIRTISGVTCLFVHAPDLTTVTAEVLVKAGSIYENHATNGISHFLEHMFFKGGKKYTTPMQVAQAVESFGGEFNAFTGGEYAGYYVKSSPEYVLRALDVLGDMMVSPIFPIDEMEREKQVVIQEIAMYEDDPQDLVYDKWKRWYYGDTSYGRSTLGTKNNVLSFTQDDLFTHKQSLYTKDNLIVVISGSYSEDGLEETIARCFGSLPSKKIMQTPKFVHAEPTKKTDMYQKNTQQSHLLFSAKGHAYTDDKKYTAHIISTILGGNMSSRFFQNIREKLGLCYYIGAFHQASTSYGTYVMRAGIDKERRDFGIEKIHQEVAELVSTSITQEELLHAQGFVVGQLQMGSETSNKLANFFGKQLLLYNDYKTIDQIVHSLQKVSVESIKSQLNDLHTDNIYMYAVV